MSTTLLVFQLISISHDDKFIQCFREFPAGLRCLCGKRGATIKIFCYLQLTCNLCIYFILCSHNVLCACNELFGGWELEIIS